MFSTLPVSMSIKEHLNSVGTLWEAGFFGLHSEPTGEKKNFFRKDFIEAQNTPFNMEKV